MSTTINSTSPSPSPLGGSAGVEGAPAQSAVSPRCEDHADLTAALRANAKAMDADPAWMAAFRAGLASGPTDMTRLGRHVLDNLAQDLAQRVEAHGSRSNAIYAQTCRIARLVKAGEIDESVARSAMFVAALDAMPDDRLKAADTVRRAWRAGLTT